jgi:hypothetical protein
MLNFGGKGEATVTWANGSTTTFTYTAVSVPLFVISRGGARVVNKKWRCTGQASQSDLTGAIMGNANLPVGDGGLKGRVKATICGIVLSESPPIFGLELAPGSEFKL